MYKLEDKNKIRQKRHMKIRKDIFGTAECPRLNVFRSNSNLEAQIIDDNKGNTLVACSTMELKLENGSNIEAAKKVGEKLAAKALEKGIENVVFDRGGYLYHGRIKAFADACREAGLKF